MTLLNAALAFVFFCNLVFMVGAAYILMRILDTTETSQINLQRAASSVIEVGTHIKVIVRRAFNEMERNNDALTARESSSGRAVAELSSQIKSLVERMKALMAKKVGDAVAADAGGADGQVYADAEEFRAKLHADLNEALAKTHALQDEIDQTKLRLKGASQANSELREEISDVKGVKQSVVDSLMQRTTELEEQLEKARERAKVAEKHAQANAVQLDEIRSQINQQTFADGGPDQSGLIEGQQDQIDALAAREKELLARIAQLEGAFARNLTEKNFIEERFLQMDSAGSAHAPLEPPAPADL
jgi:chromosome segregation ATPase